MTLELNRLTDGQLSILKEAVGRGLWDHIASEECIPKPVIDMISTRLRAEGYDVQNNNEIDLEDLLLLCKSI